MDSLSFASNGRDLPALQSESTTELRPDVLFSDLIDATRTFLRVPIAFVYITSPRGSLYLAWRGFSADASPPDLLPTQIDADHADPIVIENALRDDRLRDHPLVSGPAGARFCQVAPIVLQDGRVAGALCAMDVLPRPASNSEVTVIKYLAGHAAALIELQEMRRMRDIQPSVRPNTARPPGRKRTPCHPEGA